MDYKNRLIKITEKQLKEVQGFDYLSDNDTPHCDGQSHVSVDGRLNDEEYGEPKTAGKAMPLTPQGRVRYAVANGLRRSAAVAESVSGVNDDDSDKNGVKDFYEKPELNGKNNDDVVTLPKGVEYKIEILLAEIKKSNLMPKQIAKVLDRIIEALDLSQLPPSYIKNLRLDVQ